MSATRQPKRETMKKIFRIHAMMARGHNQKEAARLLGISDGTISSLKRRHAELWESAAAETLAKRSTRPQRVAPKTMRALATTARLVAAGNTFAEAARKLDVGASTVWSYRTDHPQLWEEAIRAAETEIRGKPDLRQQIIDQVRACARADEVPDDVLSFLRTVRLAEKLAARSGEELFPAAAGQATLTTFYRDYFLPIRLAQGSPETRRTYDLALRFWARLTGDPPLAAITAATLAKYRDSLCQLTRVNRPGKLSVNTVANRLRHVQVLLNKAGPPGYRNRDAAGIIPGPVPWVRGPKIAMPPPRVISFEQLDALYRAAEKMNKPRGLDFPAPAWWRALLVIAYNTGLRRRALFGLRMEWINWETATLVVPPGLIKSGQYHVVHLNATAMHHLQAIRTDREMVFPWALRRWAFDKLFHQLQDLAGIRRKDHFGLHNIRKTVATELWAESPQASQLALGHAGAAVTMRHYIQARGIVAAALDRLPQPAAFAEAAHFSRNNPSPAIAGEVA